MSEGDYVLGTEAGEIERLGLQHRVWRPRMLDAWRRAGIRSGQTAIDVGAGPGYASADLAEMVGAEGRVVALERSPRFLAAIQARAERLGLANIEAREHDVSEAAFGDDVADAAWCRWVLCFVADPRRTVSHVARALKPGGAAVFHEYGDYGAWRTMPPDPKVERFRELVIESWRDSGGEPDIALHLAGWLAAEGLECEVRPLIEIVRQGDLMWEWPAAFMATNARRLAELGYVGEDEAEQLARALDDVAPGTLMVTPLVVEIVARKPL